MNRKYREISNPEEHLQLIAPPANRELFKSRFAKARKMNGQPNELDQARSLLRRLDPIFRRNSPSCERRILILDSSNVREGNCLN